MFDYYMWDIPELCEKTSRKFFRKINSNINTLRTKTISKTKRISKSNSVSKSNPVSKSNTVLNMV